LTEFNSFVTTVHIIDASLILASTDFAINVNRGQQRSKCENIRCHNGSKRKIKEWIYQQTSYDEENHDFPGLIIN